MTRLKDRLVNSELESSFSAWARRRRWEQLLLRFPDLADMSVVDLGGRPSAWNLAPVKPRSVVHVNLEPVVAGEGDTVITADACTVQGIGRYDLVYSNSTIEHVGGHHRRKQFADTVRALGDNYWIQTPYRYFPIEPHIVFPFAQLLPVKGRVSLCRHWGISQVAGEVDDVLSIELLGVTELSDCFPEATILRERLAGFPKSLVAVRSSLAGA